MSKTVTLEKEAKVVKAKKPRAKRAATFKVLSKQGGKQLFEAVNKRAKRLTDGQKEITTKELKKLTKQYRVLESPSLKRIPLSASKG